ncbi:Tetratricopeptide repeat protein 33 [Exaiptasia diaphana]|nr:Tetratricopeptide repeat protein 33 [Exaiptasia diaphana]
MATIFGWKKKIPHDLSRKRASAFDDNEVRDDAIKEESAEQLLLPAKRLHSEDDNETACKISKCLLDEGASLAEQARFSEAVKKWNEALILTPDDEKLHEMKSQIFLQLDKTFEAIKCAEKAVELKPTWPAAHQALGRAQLKFGEFDLCQLGG